MTNAATLPWLDFGSWVVPLPGRGHHVFLSATDLQTAVPAPPALADPGVWLMRTESGVGVMIPVGLDIVRNGMPVIGLAVLHHGERVEVASRLARYVEIQRLVLEDGHRLIGERCPMSFDTFAAGQVVVQCPLCGVAYCEDCWELLKDARCCSQDCRFAPAPLTEPDHD